MAFSTFVILTLLLLAFSPLPVQPQTACTRECEYIYNPVCGNDGFSYPNLCFLQRAGCQNASLRIARFGPCTVPDPCTYVCDRSSNPVCGSDGVTYSNPCVLLYFSCYYTGRNLVKRHNGACMVDRPCPTTCPGSMEPVCGSDGKTYTNQCFLNREACAGRSVTLAKQGPCTTCRQICTREYVPVCGTNGLTYPNQCVLESKACEGQQVTKAYDGVCTPMACRQICTREYVPVCGSDGVTYSNQCVLESKACSGQRVTKASDGPCTDIGLQPQRPCDIACPANYAPVCGSDGKTYGNECALQAASCKGPTITKISNGECGTRQQPCPDLCPASYAPVCGSDGKTYTNECVLKGVSCRNSSITLSYPGQCASSGGSSGGSAMCTQACPITYAPVCGSDRVTYTNACTFGNAVCKDTAISKLYDGPCRN